MQIRGNIFLLILLFLGTLGLGLSPVFAQSKEESSRADKFFDNYEYSKAIPLYKRSADKNDAALRRLADCYRLVKNYREAEICYAKLVSKNSSDPKVYYYYGEALLFNNKYEEAKKQFSTYSTLNPGDYKGDMYAKACDEIRILLNKPSVYKVYNLGALNSEVSDFCPVFYKDGIVFSSERMQDMVNFNENNWTGNPYLTLVYAKGSVKKRSGKDSVAYENAGIFYKKFSGKGHVGPACFNADYSELFFTKVDLASASKNGKASLSGIYWSKKADGWNAARPMPFNNADYATGHPALSKDGQYLYFASGMPGGQGGTDIWVSKREGDSWGAPQNLGTEINTKEDESFPSVGPDNKLYFSSNGHKGFGGLDLFSAKQQDGKWGSVTNLMPPVNSTADDFGILVKDEAGGYFSSNRPGGKGGDDLYAFVLSGMINNISGKILLSNRADDGAKNVKVFLMNEKKAILQTTVTDGTGFFKFENLTADQSYNIKVDDNDPNLVNQRKFWLADSKNRIVRTVVKSKDGFFIFENLPSDLTKLTELNEEDAALKNISIAGNLYSGDDRAPVENTKVNLVNDKGEVMQSTTTNSFGSFVFMNIEPDQNFTVVLDDSDPELAKQKIYFTNKSGKEIAMRTGTPFRFSVLATDKNTMSLLMVEDSQLLVDLKGTLFSDKEGKGRIANSDIYLVDDKGNTVSASKTDAHGNFIFTNLPADKNYLVKLREDDPALASKEIFLADSRGKVVATLKSVSGKFLRYYTLPADEQSIGNIYFNDPWLKVAKMQSEARKDSMMTIIENVYYDYQKWDLQPQAVITLNKVIEVMKANKDVTINILSHTDSRGTDEFNLKLSQKRAQAAVDYMISKGIEKKRLIPIGKGETQLVNRCKNDVECSEEEHAQNRRTEFNIKSKGN
jgi:outer membrane protein OmpA-like peptidoglycan-associated protein